MRKLKLKNLLLTSWFLLLVLVSSTHILWALEKDTHEFLNKKIVRDYSILNSYLKERLGFSKGIDESLVSVNQSKTVEEWIGIGGKYEDEPAYSRSLNHFHNPLKEPWSSAGFKGTFKSSVIWAQDQGLLSVGGDWSWKKARDSFHKGLTGVIKDNRDKDFADTFRALGQVMHLVQDASVPAHVRNDTHVYLEIGGLKIGGYHYEVWVKEHHGILNLIPLDFDKSILNITPESSAPIPIANIFDTNKYNIGSDINAATGFSIGIAEYTNANFFSEDTIVLDDNVYNDYAAMLIPRAVGYSAGLLDYFFRGTLEITIPDSGIYAQTDNPGAGFTKVTLKAKNITSNGDEISDGSIELVVKYKKGSDEIYKVYPESQGIRSLPKDTPVELSFDLSQDSVPTDATDIYLFVVYKGTLGKEEGSVAVGFKDISEPTPIELANNMDMICINGVWQIAGSLEAIAQVDSNKDGIAYGTNEWDVYPHDLKNIYIKISSVENPQEASPSNYDAEIPDLAAGRFQRSLYILGDKEFTYSFNLERIGTDPNDYWTHVDTPSKYTGKTLTNQDGVTPTYYHFRGVDMWANGSLIYLNPAYPAGSWCLFDSL